MLFDMDPDVRVRSEGSIMLLKPETDVGRNWLNDHTDPGATWWCGALVCEPRYFNDIAEAANDEGIVFGN